MNLLTVKQAAQQMAISPSLLYQLVSEGKIRCFRIGRSALRFSPEQIEEYLSSCVVEVKLEPRRAPSPVLRHLKV